MFVTGFNANKLTINAKKSNFVVFRPAQKRINHQCVLEFRIIITVDSHLLNVKIM